MRLASVSSCSGRLITSISPMAHCLNVRAIPHHSASLSLIRQLPRHSMRLGTLATWTKTSMRTSTAWRCIYPTSTRCSRGVRVNVTDRAVTDMARTFTDPASFPPLVPIMVGNTSSKTETLLGTTLAPYLSDPTCAFVISSDFAHWGSRFRYTYYRAADGRSRVLRPGERDPQSPAIHESIKHVDFQCIDACETGQHDKWLRVLSDTGNTVCGRHPIGVVMAGLELCSNVLEGGRGLFRFVRYERSSLVSRGNDSSVSYASAYAVLEP